jgi:hypothetical protein
MNVPSEPHDDSDRRLERLRQLNRKLDEIIRDGDTKLPQLLAHVADTSTAAAIESLELQREVRDMTKELRDMTLWIKWLTIIITVLTLVMAYVSVAGRNHTFTSSDHAAATPPQSNQNSNQQKTNEKHD